MKYVLFYFLCGLSFVVAFYLAPPDLYLKCIFSIFVFSCFLNCAADDLLSFAQKFFSTISVLLFSIIFLPGSFIGYSFCLLPFFILKNVKEEIH